MSLHPIQVITVSARSNFPKELDAELPCHPLGYLSMDGPTTPCAKDVAGSGGEGAAEHGVLLAGNGGITGEQPSTTNEAVVVEVGTGDVEQPKKRDRLRGKANEGRVREMDYCGMLNRVLPADIRALAWAPVTEDFSARFSCSDRTYRHA